MTFILSIEKYLVNSNHAEKRFSFLELMYVLDKVSNLDFSGLENMGEHMHAQQCKADSCVASELRALW